MVNEDRRIQKTKKILSEALIALILEKGYEKVTVQDIIDRANVGRSTFYSHYEDKDQLLLSGPQNLGMEFFPNPESTQGLSVEEELDFLPLFRHAAGHVSLAKAMLGRKSGDILFGYLKNHLTSTIRNRFKGRFEKTKMDKLRLQYCCAAAAEAVMGFLVSWLEDDMRISVEEMAALCARAVIGFFEAAKSIRSQA